MQKKLKNYINKIDLLLKEEKIKNKETILEEHLTQIKFFQHERLVHLLVTIFVGIVAVLFFLFGIFIENIMILFLFTLTVLLFIPYIFHYFHLENGIQKMYDQYWILKNK